VPARSGCCQDGNGGESRGKEMHAYRTEAATDEKDLLKTFRFVVEDHAANGGRNGRDTNNGSPYGFLVTLASFSTIRIANQVLDGLTLIREVSSTPDWMASPDRSLVGPSAQNKAERDARWAGDFAGKPTVAIVGWNPTSSSEGSNSELRLMRSRSESCSGQFRWSKKVPS